MKKLPAQFGFIFFSFFFSLIVCFQSVQAQENTHFETRLTSTYSVDDVGNTHVEHAFRIKNLTPEYYISKYSLKLNSTKINNIRVVNNNHVTTPDINQTETSTEINLEFDDKVLGKDKVREFSITYLNPDIAQANGSVLEAFIPAMNSEETYNQHQVIIVTPAKFGEPSRITPKNYELTKNNQDITITYSDIQGQGVSAIFGHQQVFNFTIRYHLDNPTNQPAITQVSLPPDTAYQKMIYRQLEPAPEDIVLDDDGNWIASYYLPANDTVEVNILADALVSLNSINPQLDVEPTKEHLSSQAYWEKNAANLREAGDKLDTAQEIYQFVVDQLDYTKVDLATAELERLGASEALTKPDQATCQEFTDLFITLARINGIPARRATGYAHSNDPKLQPLSLVTDVLHAWPEYYDKKKRAWVPIDPTWADTMKNVDYFSQFDLKHIVFAYNGVSSKYPLAAGDYKLPNQKTKDIQVSFSSDWNEPEANFVVSVVPIKIFKLIPVPGKYLLTVQNKTGKAWYGNQIIASSNNQNVSFNPSEADKFDLLPFQSYSLNLGAYNTNHWIPKPDEVQLTLTNQDYENRQEISINTSKPIGVKFSEELRKTEFFQQIKPGEFKFSNLKDLNREQIIFSLAIFTGVFAIAAGSLLVFRRRK